MLAVAIKCHDDVGASDERVLDAGTKRSPLAAVDDVRDDLSPVRACNGARRVSRSIINHDHVRVRFAYPLNDVADDGALIEGRNDDEHHRVSHGPILAPAGVIVPTDDATCIDRAARYQA